jgi:hypothetical protein
MINVPKIINQHVRSYRDTPFLWNAVDDCIGWAGGIANSILGRDVLTDIRGTYNTEQEAKRVMVARHWNSLADVAASRFAEIPLLQARSGDWAVIDNPDGTETIGVFCYQNIFAKGKTGIAMVSRLKARKAYRVA